MCLSPAVGFVLGEQESEGDSRAGRGVRKVYPVGAVGCQQGAQGHVDLGWGWEGSDSLRT